MAELLEVGRLGKAHGLRGEIMVHLSTDRAERVAKGAVLTTADGTELTVASSRPHQRGHIVVFKEVTDRNAAEALRGVLLSAPPLDDPDALWVHELVGCTVVDTEGTEHGVVVEVEANPASDLLVLDRNDHLVPLTFFVEQRDGVIVIDPPPGLFDF